MHGHKITNPLPKVNDEGDEIYLRFKVSVEATTGLM